VRGNNPVRIEARAGWQTRFGVMQARKQIEMGRLDLAPLDAEAVASLLVGGDEQDVGSYAHVIAGVPGTMFLVCRGNLPAVGGFGKVPGAVLPGAMVTMS
jgi:hypothetical protein